MRFEGREVEGEAVSSNGIGSKAFFFLGLLFLWKVWLVLLFIFICISIPPTLLYLAIFVCCLSVPFVLVSIHLCSRFRLPSLACCREKVVRGETLSG